ncbi:type I-B CRISPR-associated protein Cas7/Cst2/DevR [Clostridium sp. cel8]|jgi:CRISPR-associated protein Cst2|uniref:type I-B CRISPR-associated protein Cas7/Cst2/DevR n=1 Tax=Clostridium sp. cel8 TaxID=2663123 RepID=UPI0015F6C6CB|nr:type I-B CRISPR-associated protein Cas7/Cst2/DevR [Clostridium sp. cel8]MBA5851865.1 type I-B CRISPR-associated protein Cas7/Cst2/DevR [Clostridium sp. cel8]
MNKGLTLTVVFQAQSLNFGEGIANISELKKLTRGDGNLYTFASRQCLRYDIVRLGSMFYNWNTQVVDKSKGTVQFRDDCTIKDSEEMDLFGYMKTAKKNDDEKGGSNIRSAVARLSHAISLEPYRSDMDFLNNKGLADRIGEHPNLANVEQHFSFYTYTITVDLDKVGNDGNINLDKKYKVQRVNQLLSILKVLNRNIRGRQENLAPLFIVGGIYDIPNPFFLGRIKLSYRDNKPCIDSNILKQTLETKIFDISIDKSTSIGMVSGVFNNEDELKEVFKNRNYSVEKFFDNLQNGVKAYYGV